MWQRADSYFSMWPWRFICVYGCMSSRIHTCDMTHLHVWHDSCICDMTQLYVRYDSFIRVTCHDKVGTGVFHTWISHVTFLEESCCMAMSQIECIAVCCSVLQCVAVCCSVLQCVAVCCSVLQCVAVCCTHEAVMSCFLKSRVAYASEWGRVCCSVLQCVADWAMSRVYACMHTHDWFTRMMFLEIHTYSYWCYVYIHIYMYVYNIYMYTYIYICIYVGMTFLQTTHTATQCNTLQHIATHCNKLQCTATL